MASFIVRTGIIALTALFVFNVVMVPWYDWDQCSRKCRWTLAGHRGMDRTDIRGERESADTCVCKDASGHILARGVERRYDLQPPGFPYLSKNSSVCGLDGVMYDSAEAATKSGVKIINCGPCGTCSTVQDVLIYRKFANPLTKMLSVCGMLYTFTSESLARQCLHSMFSTEQTPGGFTPKCVSRFIDNYGCTLAHCYKDCLFKFQSPLFSNINVNGVSSHSGVQDGSKLNPCMLCEEIHCSPVFISSGGANHRYSGTATDVVRPGDEICPHVNAVYGTGDDVRISS